MVLADRGPAGSARVVRGVADEDERLEVDLRRATVRRATRRRAPEPRAARPDAAARLLRPLAAAGAPELLDARPDAAVARLGPRGEGLDGRPGEEGALVLREARAWGRRRSGRGKKRRTRPNARHVALSPSASKNARCRRRFRDSQYLRSQVASSTRAYSRRDTWRSTPGRKKRLVELENSTWRKCKPRDAP